MTPIEISENPRRHLEENNNFLFRNGQSSATPGIGGGERTNPKVLSSAKNNTHLTAGPATRRRKGKRWEAAKEEIQNEILNQLDFDAFKGLSKEELSGQLRLALQDFIQENIPLEFSESLNQMVNELLYKFVGSSPLEPFLNDGKIGKVIIPPRALDGSIPTTRRLSAGPLGQERLIEMGALTEEMVIFLQAAVQGALNIVVSGGTGSGKTTILNMLSSFIPGSDRIITIEHSAELQLRQEHVARMETRMANGEGKGEVVIRDLIKNALQMRPDRIIVGECRGSEAFDMVQAMNTGYDGSLTTLHANSPRDVISQLSSMILMTGMKLPEQVTHQQIASAVDIIVQLERMPDGSRKVTRITEVSGMMKGKTVAMQDIFSFKSKVENGKVIGHHEASGIRPECAGKLDSLGQKLPDFGLNRETEKINAA